MKDLTGLLDHVNSDNLERRLKKIYHLIKTDFLSRDELIHNNDLFKKFLVDVASIENADTRLVDFIIYSIFNSEFDSNIIVEQPQSLDPRKVSTPFKFLLEIHHRFISKIDIQTLVDFGSGEGFFIWLCAMLDRNLKFLGIEIEKDKFEKSQKLLNNLGERKRLLQRDFFEFDYDKGDESIAYAYDPFDRNDIELVKKFMQKIKSLNFKHIVLIEGYTQNFSKNLHVLDNYKVVEKLKNYKDSNEERERYAFCLSLK
jgi:hypothetical protein